MVLVRACCIFLFVAHSVKQTNSLKLSVHEPVSRTPAKSCVLLPSALLSRVRITAGQAGSGTPCNSSSSTSSQSLRNALSGLKLHISYFISHLTLINVVMHPDHPRGRSALFVLAALAIALLVIHRANDSDSMHYSAAVEACSTLPGRAAQLCSNYHLATGQAKFDAAVHWRQLSPASCECFGFLVQPASRLMLAYTRCARLAPSRGLGPDCSSLAPAWFLRLADACTGITMECLQDDMHSSSSGSSCAPLQEGDACDEEQQLTCSQGFCGGELQTGGHYPAASTPAALQA